MKEKRFFPEKGLLMLSGAAFLLLIVPAWVPGFVWCGVAAVLLCAAVWRLPVSRQRVRALLSNPVHMALSLAFNGALAVNFYHNWVDSQKMQRVAGVLGMENGLFVPLCAAFFAIAAAPAAGCVISYYVSAGQEDYRRTKAETLRSGETGIPMGKALLILFAVFVVGISAILRANFYYMDDSPRAALGYKQWDYFSRYLSTALATLVHGGDYLADAAPLPQILAMLIMAVSGILMGYIVYGRTTFSGWELAVLSILGLNPYFLGCVSFRFDAPYMALSVLAAVVPLLCRNRNTAAYVLASGLGILAVCTSYQAAAGIFPMLVVALALRMWNRGESIREVGLFCLKSAAGYALGLIFFKLVIMIPADTSYVGNALPPAGELIPHFLKNLRSYYSLVLSDFKPFWLIAAVLAVIAFCVRVVLDSRRKTVPAIAMTAAALVLMGLMCFGLYPALAATVFAPRAMYGFGVLLTVFGMTAAEGKKRFSLKIPAVVLSWVFLRVCLHLRKRPERSEGLHGFPHPAGDFGFAGNGSVPIRYAGDGAAVRLHRKRAGSAEHAAKLPDAEPSHPRHLRRGRRPDPIWVLLLLWHAERCVESGCGFAGNGLARCGGQHVPHDPRRGKLRSGGAEIVKKSRKATAFRDFCV